MDRRPTIRDWFCKRWTTNHWRPNTALGNFQTSDQAHPAKCVHPQANGSKLGTLRPASCVLTCEWDAPSRVLTTLSGFVTRPMTIAQVNSISRLIPVARCRDDIHPRIRCQLPVPLWCQHMRWSTATQSNPIPHSSSPNPISCPNFLSFTVTKNFWKHCDLSHVFFSSLLLFSHP